MELSEVYSKNVKKTSVSNLCVNGNMPIIQRDPNLIKLERDVFAKMLEISPPEETPPSKTSNLSIKNVSFEEALKELVSIRNNS
jgi:hypothetical protein